MTNERDDDVIVLVDLFHLLGDFINWWLQTVITSQTY